jgi:hypothetical protein
VKWTLPSSVSPLGETVAAFAAHMDEALLTAANKSGARRRAVSNTFASLPENPNLRSAPTSGLGIGGSTACPTPIPHTCLIFAKPSNAAAFGLLTRRRFAADARFPLARPP